MRLRVIELKKSLHSYGVELILPATLDEGQEPASPTLVEPASGSDEAQLSFGLERPPPRLRVLRRHPSM